MGGRGYNVDNVEELITENLIKFPELTLTELECAAIQWLEENETKSCNENNGDND